MFTISSELLHGFRLGTFNVEPLRGAVTGPKGVAHHLEPKVMDVFVHLARHANEVVTREELQEAVWSGRAVTDESLTRAIRELRHAIADIGGDSSCIETVPKRGYCLVGEIGTPDGSALESGQESSAGHTTRHLPHIVFVAVLATIAIGIALWLVDPLTDRRNPASLVSPKVSIAVLPFENMSSDLGNEHFGNGLAEEIRSLLASNPDLKVIGRSSSEAFKGSNTGLKEIGRILGVSNLLEGSVRRSGETLRVTVRLADSVDESTIWDQTYERPITDIFELQDEIAAAAIRQVEGNMALHVRRQHPTENLDAYALYVEAQGLLSSFRLRNLRGAEEKLLRAVELDPDFAEAHELLAFTYWEQSGVAMHVDDATPLQRQAAAEAIRLDPDLAFARFLWIDTIPSTHLSEMLEDLTALARTGQRRPDVLGMLTWYLIYAGYFQEALVVALRYLDLDPYTANSHRHVYYALHANGRQQEAIEALEIAAHLGGGPNSLFLAQSQYVLRRDEESIAAFADAWRDNGMDAGLLPELLAGAAHPDTGQVHLDRYLPELLAALPEEQRFLVQKHLTVLYLQFGYLDRYYELLEELGIGQFGGHIELTWMGTMLRDSGFTAHPGYQKIAASVKFHELWNTRGPPDMCEKRDDVWVCE